MLPFIQIIRNLEFRFPKIPVTIGRIQSTPSSTVNTIIIFTPVHHPAITPATVWHVWAQEQAIIPSAALRNLYPQLYGKWLMTLFSKLNIFFTTSEINIWIAAFTINKQFCRCCFSIFRTNSTLKLINCRFCTGNVTLLFLLRRNRILIFDQQNWTIGIIDSICQDGTTLCRILPFLFSIFRVLLQIVHLINQFFQLVNIDIFDLRCCSIWLVSLFRTSY